MTIEYLPLSSIIIPQQYAKSHPSPMKRDACANWYKQHGILDRMLVVDQNNILIDGYIGYLVLMEAGVTEYIVERRVADKRISYIGGRHPACPKMYYWEIDSHTQNLDALRPGNCALVDTKYGRAVVKIVVLAQATESPTNKPLRRVLRGFQPTSPELLEPLDYGMF